MFKNYSLAFFFAALVMPSAALASSCVSIDGGSGVSTVEIEKDGIQDFCLTSRVSRVVFSNVNDWDLYRVDLQDKSWRADIRDLFEVSYLPLNEGSASKKTKVIFYLEGGGRHVIWVKLKG